MSVSAESIQAKLRSILNEIQELKILWQYKHYDEYRDRARRFLLKNREAIRNAASTSSTTLTLVRCIRALNYIDNVLPEYDEKELRSDEDLLLDVMEQFNPDPLQAKSHEYHKHTARSNIYKRRAFAEALDGDLDAAVALMKEALGSARKALEVSPKDKVDGASKHLYYLTFHLAVLKMRASMKKPLHTEALTAWREACKARKHQMAPANLFPGYLWDSDDLDAYSHLIEAQEAWFEGNYSKAVREYESWTAPVVQKHNGRWRFRNVEVRRHLSMILDCLMGGCDGCEECRQAARHLQQSSQDWFLGAAGRYLAANGLALHQIGASDPSIVEQVVNKIKAHIPLDSYHAEPCSQLPEGHVWRDLPDYFTSLPSEAKRLEQIGFVDEGLRQFVLRRLQEFLEIVLEYEEGRVQLLGAYQSKELSGASLSGLGDRIVQARRARKGVKDRGVSDWESATRILARVEISQDYKDAFDAYESVLTKTSGLFPTIVRVVKKPTTGEPITVVETLTGKKLNVESQFSLNGDFAFLPPRYRSNPVDLQLLANDRSWWVPSNRLQGIFALKSVPLWVGSWSELQQEHFESFSMDYKRELPRRLAKHLAAFANTEGGWLIFGIYDPQITSPENCVRGLTLIEAAEILDKIGLAGITEVTPPMMPTDFFRAYPAGQLVVLCKISPSPTPPQPPHRVDGSIYLRVGTQSMPISDSQWSELSSSKKRTSPA